MEKAKEEWDALVDAGKWVPSEDGGFMEWLEAKVNNLFSSPQLFRHRAAQKEFPKATYGGALDKKLRQIYNKYADRQFLDSLTIVHWVSPEHLQRYLNAGKKHQTSAEGYLPGNPIEQHWGFYGVGVKMEGWVVLGSNENLYSGFEGYKAQPGKEGSGFVKGAGIASRPDHPEDSDILIYDKETFIKNSGKGSGFGGDDDLYRNNEFIVDNWKPVAIVVVGGKNNNKLASAYGRKGIPTFQQVAAIAEENNLPMIDENQNPIEVENSNEKI
jgi:hypothetical protein